MKLILLSMLTAVLAGCASLSENECMTADWESIGYQDGSRGYGAGRISDHTEACAEYGIKPDREMFEEGRLRGLELFCTVRNGLRVGRQGSSYNGVCPITLEPGFLHGFELGRDLHEIDGHMQELQSRIQQVQAELQRRDPPLSDRERDALLYQLRDLERTYGRAQSEQRHLESDAFRL